MKKIINITAIAAIFLTIYSCTEKIDNLATDQIEQKLIVFGEITTDTMAHKVRLTKTTDYYDNQPEPVVSNATVALSDGTNTIILKESKTEPGSYFTPEDYYGEVGKTYSLAISNVDINNDGNNEEYEALSTIPPIGKIDAVKVKYVELIDLWKVELYAQEPAETRDFYIFKVAINGVMLTDSIDNITYGDDEFFNGNQAKGNWVQSIEEDNAEYLKIGDTVTLEMGSVPEGYFDFIDEYQSESGYKDPMFSGPPANVRTNISNGALGYFAAYSIARNSVIYNGEIDDSY